MDSEDDSMPGRGRRTGDARRHLPGIDSLLRSSELSPLLAQYSRELVVRATRDTLEAARVRMQRDGSEADIGSIAADVGVRLAGWVEPRPGRVINATGVILHTNLGRAPLSPEALAAMDQAARGYSALEYDPLAGARGSRHDHLAGLLREITGAEDALVVNNNASAVLLALAALAAGREVLISRGQLVEIGGGFRIPEVLRQSGATLVEVGTTNRTYREDYAAAINDNTGVLLRVHTSNFRVVGFVHEVALEELVRLTADRGIAVVDDLGSGCLIPTERYGLSHEPMVQESVRSGADLVCFSGDKLLGGPQAGVLVGKTTAVARLKRHPLIRAVRPDKATLAGLGATLVHYLRGDAEERVPVWRMIATPSEELERRARRLAGELDGHVDVLETAATVGGGSLPGETLNSRAIAVGTNETAEAIASLLRRARPTPIIPRVADGRVLLDLRTVAPDEDQALVEALRVALETKKAGVR